MLELKLQYFSHLMRRTDSFEKTLLLEKIEGGKRRGQQRIRWFDGITDSMDISLSKLYKFVMDWDAWHAAVHGITNSQTRMSNWTEQKNFPQFGVLHTVKGFGVVNEAEVDACLEFSCFFYDPVSTTENQITYYLKKKKLSITPEPF